MKVALIGYGKMGHELEPILLERGHTIVLKASSEHPFIAEDLKDADVAIEFSRPDAAVTNIFKCLDAGVPVVVGTTGWYNRLDEVKSRVAEHQGTLMYATNFSIGVNVLFHLNRQLARIMNVLEEYEPGILEIHHAAKLDTPSGTAITLAEGILDELKRKNKWVNDIAQQPDELSVVSQRQGEVPGTHMIHYSSINDSMSLIHEAKSRRGFAVGAVKAAEWVADKKGVFTIHDFLKF